MVELLIIIFILPKWPKIDALGDDHTIRIRNGISVAVYDQRLPLLGIGADRTNPHDHVGYRFAWVAFYIQQISGLEHLYQGVIGSAFAYDLGDD